VDVGRELGRDGDLHDFAAVDRDDALLDDVAALDHQPGVDRLGEGRLHQDAGRLAGAVFGLVRRQFEGALVGVGAPAGVVGIDRPEGDAAHLLAAAAVGDGGHGQIGAALIGRELDGRLAGRVGGHALALDLGIDRRPARGVHTEFDRALALPVAPVEDYLDRLVAHRFAGPVDGDDVDASGVAAVDDGVGGAETGV